MRRFIISAIALMPALSMASGNDLFINQRNAADTATLTRLVVKPAGSADGVFGFNGSTQLPVFLGIGPGLSLSGGILDAGPAAPVSWNSINGKPSFAAVSTSGAYADLSGQPALFSGAYSALTGIPSTFAPAVHTQPFSTITNTPTTQAGYGITDGVTAASLSTTLGGYATSGALSSGLATKFNIPTGTTAQYLRGDGSLATLPAGSGGTVTSITAGTGLTGGTITGSGTISLPATGTAGTYANVTTDAQGRVTAGTSLAINDNPARSLVTTTAATGFQVSPTRIAQVCYEGSFSTTSTIGGPSGATVFLETADANSTTPADWTTKATQTYSNNISLAVTLNQVQGNNWAFCRYIPAGKYVRIRSGNITGTASVAINTSQQEVLQ